MTNLDRTFAQMVKDKRGTIYWQGEANGYQGMIRRGGASVTAYLGLSKDHPWAGARCYDIPLDVHGGLTFGRWGDGELFPKGLYWIGWDYGHLGDFSFYDLPRHEWMERFYLEDITHNDSIRWTPQMVLPELREAATLLEEISRPVNMFVKLGRRFAAWKHEIWLRWFDFTMRIGYQQWRMRRASDRLRST